MVKWNIHWTKYNLDKLKGDKFTSKVTSLQEHGLICLRILGTYN